MFIATTQEAADILRGDLLLSEYGAKEIAIFKFGCGCQKGPYVCLFRLLRALKYSLTLGIRDEVYAELYDQLLLLINGDVSILIGVNAGANQTTDINDASTSFQGVLTIGSSGLVSTLWTQVSGPNILTLAGVNTLTLLVTGQLLSGSYVFKLTALDTKGNYTHDDVQLLVTAASVQIRWGYYSAEPDLNNIVYQFSKLVSQGSLEYTLDFTSAINSSDQFIAIEQPAIEPDKIKWFNTPLNYGTIPDSVFKDKVTLNGKDIIVSRTAVVFDSSVSTLKLSV